MIKSLCNHTKCVFKRHSILDIYEINYIMPLGFSKIKKYICLTIFCLPKKANRIVSIKPCPKWQSKTSQLSWWSTPPPPQIKKINKNKPHTHTIKREYHINLILSLTIGFPVSQIVPLTGRICLCWYTTLNIFFFDFWWKLLLSRSLYLCWDLVKPETILVASTGNLNER